MEMHQQPQPIKPWGVLPATCLICYLVLASLILWVGRGTFGAFMLGLAFAVFVGLPSFFIALAGFVAGKLLNKQQWLGYARKGMAVSGFIVALVIPLWGSSEVARHDVRQAQAFCEALAPVLDAQKASAGAYPANLAKLMPPKGLPWLFKDDSFYFSDGLMFKFSVPDEAGLMGGWEYTSSNRTWQHWD
ncbi:MAG: hypothetical protein CTY16_03125 [Methylobacter sp.]|nr:MAG: hypothetical protein CTY16_03125 [Methylobacter sp.]